MEANANLQTHVCKPRDRILHRQSGQTTPNGVILMGPRRTKERHDAVALYLVDDTVVAMNSILHQIEHRLQALHRKLGITQALDQAWQIADIQKKHQKAFAFGDLSSERGE